jgi:hypothetical protein
MVTLARQSSDWNRASYLSDEAVREPQPIADLMEQLLSRYAGRAKIQVVISDASDQPHHGQAGAANQLLGSTR